LVDRSLAGWTHEELRERLRVRVHNTLLDLVREKRVRRDEYEAVFLYLSANAARAASQRRRRLQQGATAAARLEPFLIVEILVEVIRGARVVPEAAAVAARLAARGLQVSIPAVEDVYQRHGLGKKTAPSPSTRSRR
jgi:hypothetical protein